MTPGEQSGFWRSALVLLTALIALPLNVEAQSISLSAEQQAMLDQLPPAQREQALRALGDLQSRGGAQQTDNFSSLNDELSGERAGVEEGLESADRIPTASDGSTLVIAFEMPEELLFAERTAIEEDRALSQLLGTGIYPVNEFGAIELPGIGSLVVGGLTEQQIELRLGAERALELLNVTVNILEPERSGVEALEVFGYDVFDGQDGLFDPVTSGPVPPDYTLGPGDSIRVQLFGNVNGIYEFEVTRDGILNLPEIGPLTVVGLPFSEFRADLNRRVQETLIGTQVSITVGQLRTIRVFVLGDAIRPGSYVVSSLGTISSAIYAAGGVSEIGSLRNIQLKRQGETVTTLDLYDLLLEGDTSDDVRMQSGDVVFIPPVGAQITVDGAVRRPAVYEIRSGTSIGDVLSLAGGLADNAYAEGARIERIRSGAGRAVVNVNASIAAALDSAVTPGDVVFVPEVLPDFSETVMLSGHVQRPGPYQWRDGMRLTDVIGSLTQLKVGADKGYVLIRRESVIDRSVSVVSADLELAIRSPGSAANIELRPLDQVHIFDLEFGRQRVIEPILDELELQSRFGLPNSVVSVTGTVRAPGRYPLEANMRVSDLIRAAGDLAEEAYATKAELVRYDVVDNAYRTTDVVDIDLAAVLRGDPVADIALAEHDNLRISKVPEWDTLWTVSVEGEVTFPGTYRVRRGETLANLLERAGGLTDAAFPRGAIFLRESLREQEQEQIEVLARRLESDLTALSLQAGDTSSRDTLSTGRELLSQLRETEAVGRLVIDVDAIAQGRSGAEPLELRDGDQLFVPQVPQSVTVLGETQQNTSHLYDPVLTRDDYIDKSGGLTRRADRKLIYVVRASGAVQAGGGSRWFGRNNSGKLDILPGDTIVVPLETDRLRPLTFWTQVTQILYQAAIAVAAVQTFNNN